MTIPEFSLIIVNAGVLISLSAMNRNNISEDMDKSKKIITNGDTTSRAPKRGVILDIDGTLWDALENITLSWNAYIRSFSEITQTITQEEMRGVVGKTMFQIADILFPHLPVGRRRELLEGCMRYEISYLSEHPGRVYPHVFETFVKLAESGWHLYIVSNCQKGYIEDALNGIQIQQAVEPGKRQVWNMIEDYICFEDTLEDKDFNISLCVKRNGLDYAVYVGDTAGDLDMSRRAGVDFVYASYGFGYVDHLVEGVRMIEDFSLLPSVLDIDRV